MEPSKGREQGDGPDRTEEELARNYRQLRGILSRSLTRRLGLTLAEFEEFYQEAWGEVVQRARAGERIRNQRAFITRIIENKWKMELRRRHRHPTLPLDRAQEVPEGAPLRGVPLPPVDERFSVKERTRLALELIESVPDERRRKVLKLRLACDLSAPEVQRQLGVTERTYRRLLTEAMKDVEAGLEAIERGAWCDARRAIIVAYAEGRASEDEAAQARRHLRDCAPCRALVAIRRSAAPSTPGRPPVRRAPRPA